MKVCFVTPRYGEEVVGGAEHAARMLAERLHAHTGWQVVAFTSCAIDAHTWRNHYPAGELVLNGVSVRRYATLQERDAQFLHTSWKVHSRPKLASDADQELWVDQQGPLTPELIRSLPDENADVYVFYPYLYYPTVRGLPRVSQRSVLHPAAHDEIPLRMSIYQRIFSQAGAFVFQTEGERALVEREFHVGARPQLLLGLGVEPKEGNEHAFRQRFGLQDIPYVLCLGRVDAGKGSVLLSRFFSQFKQRVKLPHKLVFVGPAIEPLEPHSDIVVAGTVNEDEKWGALRGASVLISPSPFEAFSLVLLESWSAGRPVLVNGACLATREHVVRSHGGLLFEGYAAFEAALVRLLNDSDLSHSIGENGRRYVEENYLWPQLIGRYAEFLESVALRCGQSQRNTE